MIIQTSRILFLGTLLSSSLLQSTAIASSFSDFLPESMPGDWNLSLQQELAHTREQLQKSQTQLTLEWNQTLSDHWSLTAIARLEWDTQLHLSSGPDRPDNYSDFNQAVSYGEHGQIQLREFYFDGEWAGAYWRLGKQQVVWGQADGLKVLDVVTPQTFREFILDDFDDSRIPLWMINAEIPIGDDHTLQLLWIPDTSYHELAATDSAFEVTSPLRTPAAPLDASIVSVATHPLDKPDHWLKDSDLGVRWSSFWSGWDLTANYLYHYRDFSVPYLQKTELQPGQNQILVSQEYERSHLVGATASNAFGDFTLRAEVGWYSHSFHITDSPLADQQSHQGIAESRELSSVIGLDWQGLTDTFISVQWFQSYLPNHQSDMTRDSQEQTLSLLAERNFANDTWTAKVQGLYSINRQDQLWRFKLSHLLLSNLELWLGADVFSGDSDGLYGQFDQQDRWVAGFEWGF